MIAVKDPAYIDALYGRDGTSTPCQRCGSPADYLQRADRDAPWTAAQAWCLVCRPRRGRRPHHGERSVRAFLSSAVCVVCTAPATGALTAEGDPPLSHVRRGTCTLPAADVLSRATAYCTEHLPVVALGPQGSAAAHPYADAQLLREVLQDPRATSARAIAHLMGVRDGGTTTAALLRNHAMHLAADPSFPPLPPARTHAEWGAQAWAHRSS